MFKQLQPMTVELEQIRFGRQYGKNQRLICGLLFDFGSFDRRRQIRYHTWLYSSPELAKVRTGEEPPSNFRH